MSAQLSHGLPWLYAAGNQIRSAATDLPVLLRGVNRSGMEYSAPQPGGDFLGAAALTRQDMEQIASVWGCNIVRLPFNQEWTLHGHGPFSAEAYRCALDQVVEWAASCGAYTLLDLQWISVDTAYGQLDGGSPNYVPPLPNPDTLQAWPLLAERYREEPAVLFDLFNEPHDRLPSDPNPLWRIDPAGRLYPSGEFRVGPDHWTPWANKLIDAIHLAHPKALACVSGVNWGYDLRGVRIQGPNVIYSAHVYPNRPRWEWRDRFGFAGLEAPLFLAEWGGGDADVEWGARLLSFIEGRSCGWTAWSWADRPHLVQNAQAGQYQPTAFGAFVRSAIGSAPYAASGEE